MTKLAIMDSMSSAFYKAGFQLKKHSPEILIVTGVIGTVASAVMACKATLKVNQVIEKSREDIDKIHVATETGETLAGESYSAEDSRKDLAVVYTRTALDLVKLYAPAVGLGLLSLGSILASNDILRKRNIALGAAYATIDKSFKEYRSRVVERFGKEVDRQLKYDIKTEKVEKVVTDPETGKEKKVKETIEVTGLDGYSEYARFFDDGCRGWEKNPEMNLMFLRAQQQYANDLLHSRGFVFLNEVYRNLGIPETKAGQVVGWVYDPENGSGDNYIDFGIYDINKPKARDFVNGYERTILLDFNVDGNILDLMP